MNNLMYTLLELADSTSRNLAYSYRDDVNISFGEETITEFNLLELQRRHPDVVTLSTYSRPKEACNGADWEWHIIGRSYVLKMRIQAKRVQKNNVLKVNHTVRASGANQLDLLINGSQQDGVRPVYCIYCTEDQRDVWRTEVNPRENISSEYGCLLVGAEKIRSNEPKKLKDIEKYCIPWHYLANDARFYIERSKKTFASHWQDELLFLMSSNVAEILRAAGPPVPGLDRPQAEFPTFSILNGFLDRQFNDSGVCKIEDYRPPSHKEVVEHEGTPMYLQLDVRDFSGDDREY